MMAKIDVALSINDIRESCPWLRNDMNMLVGGTGRKWLPNLISRDPFLVPKDENRRDRGTLEKKILVNVLHFGMFAPNEGTKVKWKLPFSSGRQLLLLFFFYLFVYFFSDETFKCLIIRK